MHKRTNYTEILIHYFVLFFLPFFIRTSAILTAFGIKKKSDNICLSIHLQFLHAGILQLFLSASHSSVVREINPLKITLDLRGNAE